MKISDVNERKLRKIMYDGNLGWIFDRNREFLFERLNGFAQAYAQRTQHVSSGHWPKTATVGDLVDEYDKNRHRVDTLLQALAFNCSEDILAMLWAVLMGARIEHLSYEYQRRNTSRLSIKIVFPDGSDGAFVSTELWDAAIFRLAGLSKTDDHPMIESFYPLHLPRDTSSWHWRTRTLQWVADFHGSPPFCPSLIAPENVQQVADAIVDAVKLGWLAPPPGSRLEASRRDPIAETEVREHLAQDAALSVKLTPEGRRVLRRDRFYRQLRPANTDKLHMLKNEMERVLADPQDYTSEDLEEIRDELFAVEKLLDETS